MPRLLIRALLAAVALTLAGCASDPAAEPAPAPAETTGSPTGAPTAYDDYVALGDSYTAAPLVPPTDTSNVCLRSGVNYPALVAEAMPGTTLTDVSCSGADTADTRNAQRGMTGSVPPQLDALTRGTDLVTVGLGGNDDGLFGSVLGQCTQLRSSDPTGSPCATRLGAGVDASLTRIRANVAGVVEDVRERSPRARILVVGYPQIVPASGTCADLPLADGDYPFAREVNAGLTKAVAGAAKDSSAEYVDVWAASAGHDICAADPWINGRVTSASRALAYHPLAVEQRMVARLLLDALSAR